MSVRYSFTEESWRILENLLLHEDNGDLYRVIKIRDVSKNMEIAKAWDRVEELFTYPPVTLFPRPS